MPTFDLSGGVILRPLDETDDAALYALIEENRGRLARWMPWAEGPTLDATRAFIRSTIAQLARNDGFQTAIEVDGRLAGMVGTHGVSWLHRSTSVGYWLGGAYEGRGIMTRAVRAHVDYAFRTMGLHRVELRAAVDNARSRAVAERLGFRQEGICRDAERLGAHFHDIALYAVLEQDWPTHGL